MTDKMADLAEEGFNYISALVAVLWSYLFFKRIPRPYEVENQR